MHSSILCDLDETGVCLLLAFIPFHEIPIFKKKDELYKYIRKMSIKQFYNSELHDNIVLNVCCHENVLFVIYE